MDQNILEFEKIRQDLISLINNFPKPQREVLLFDRWSLKDIVSHLSNWMVHDIDCLEAIKENRIPVWEPDVDEFNQRGVDKRKDHPWDEVFAEFISLGERLIRIYKEMPSKLWNHQIWPDNDLTPERFLSDDISHWLLESDNIQNKINNLK